jgi:hypothetical protein
MQTAPRYGGAVVRWLEVAARFTRGVLALALDIALSAVALVWTALVVLVAAVLVLLLTCAGCAVEGERVSSDPCATCGGKGVNETTARDVVLCAVLAGCASEGVSVDAGVDAEGPTRGPGVADSAGLAGDAGVAPDVVVGVDAGADVARVVDVAVVDLRVIWDLSADVPTCSHAKDDLDKGGMCVVPGTGSLVWVDSKGSGFGCIWSGVVTRSCWTWDLFDRQRLTLIAKSCADCLSVAVTP